MPNTASSRSLEAAVIDLVWRVWTHLGVRGWNMYLSSAGVDVEPLVLLTPFVAREDGRLYDEALDWCVRNTDLISAVRLKRLLSTADDDVAAAFAPFSGHLQAHLPRANWPAGSKMDRLRLSGKSARPDLGRPELAQLRLRATFGVSARAEVIRALTIDRAEAWTANELADEVGFGKGNVVAALDMLALAGVVSVERSPRVFRYRLARREALVAFAQPLPLFQPDWQARVKLLALTLRISPLLATPDHPAVATNLVASLRAAAPAIRDLGLAPVLPPPSKPAFAVEVGRLLHDLIDCWAIDGSFDMSDATVYEIRRDHGWSVYRLNPGQPSEQPALPDWRRRPVSHATADDSFGMSELAHGLFSDAFQQIGVTIEPFRHQPEVVAFAAERLRAVDVGGSLRVTDAFLRVWRLERLARSRAMDRSVPAWLGP